ncbi:MAG: transcription elongation factor GreA [Candidatus Methylacidiphilales bacterium]
MEVDFAEVEASERFSSDVTAKLKNLQPGTFCQHKSWGIGQIKEWNLPLGQMLIDFADKPGHAMAFEYAAQSLQPLPPDHLEARVFSEPDAVKAEAQSNPVTLIQRGIESLGPQATAERFERILVPKIIPAEGWKKWWDGVKRALKKDPHFTVPSRRNEPILIHDAPQDHGSLTLEEFKAAIGPKAQVEALDRLLKHWGDVKDPAVAAGIVASVTETLSKMPRTQSVLALELALAREQLIEEAKLPAITGPQAFSAYVPTSLKALSDHLNSLPTAKQARCLERVKTVFGEKWEESFIALLADANSRTMEVILDSFEKENRAPEVFAALERLARERKLNLELLIWLCKNRKGSIRALMGPQIFYSILAVLEFDQLSGTKKSTRLSDLLLRDKELVKDLLEPASDEEVRDITRAILFSSVFEELDKRSLLATIVKLYPFVQSMIVGDNKREEVKTFIVSWESLEAKRLELEDIINKKIPENSREIAIARSYGDLRENHEFKSAKEMQSLLMRRRAELEVMLTQAQATDFKGVSTNEVNIGTTVTLTDVDSGAVQTVTILGAWDSDPDKGIVSYQTPMAQALLKNKPGQTVDLPLESGGKRRVRIEAIQAFNP